MTLAFINSTNEIVLITNKSPTQLSNPENLRVLSFQEPEYDRELYACLPKVQDNVIAFDLVPRANFQEVIKKRKTDVIQKHLDSIANSKGYDSILSAVSYAIDPTGPFYQESLVFAKWRNDCWVTGFTILAGVEANNAPIPTEQELINLLPTITI